MSAEYEKRVVARKALELLKEERVELLGLGSGTTVAAFVEELAKSDLGAKIKAIPSSSQIEAEARRHGLMLVDPEYGKPDLTIDGADEIDGELNLLKGGGGALVREKILATSSDYYLVIADHSKVVNRLCTKRPLPVEVLPYGYLWTKELIEGALNSGARLRYSGDGIFVSDNGNYILDVHCQPLEEPESVEKFLKLYPGVVEVGIFTELVDEALVAFGDEVRRFTP